LVNMVRNFHFSSNGVDFDVDNLIPAPTNFHLIVSASKKI